MNRALRPLYLAAFFFSFHLALLSYLNSSALSTHTGSIGTTLAYTISSALSLVCIFFAPFLVGRIGVSRMLALLLAISTGLLGVLGLLFTRDGFVSAFVLYFSLNTVIWYVFDLLLEHYSRVQNTGNIRGLYLTLMNIAWVAAPLIASALSIRYGFVGTYLVASGAVLVSLLVVIATTRVPKNPHTPTLYLHQAFSELVAHPEARRIVSLYFVLQFFYAWMVLYMTPYLTASGFGMHDIGVILSIMLLPFVLLQYLAGKIADQYRNERSIMIIGFCIMGLATLLLAIPESFVYEPSLTFFAVVLFLTRVGASIIEVAAESKFFKVVTEKDTALISTLRMTSPLAYIIAPLTGVLVIATLGVAYIFVFLGLISIGAMLYAFRMKAQ